MHPPTCKNKDHAHHIRVQQNAEQTMVQNPRKTSLGQSSNHECPKTRKRFRLLTRHPRVPSRTMPSRASAQCPATANNRLAVCPMHGWYWWCKRLAFMSGQVSARIPALVTQHTNPIAAEFLSQRFDLLPVVIAVVDVVKAA